MQILDVNDTMIRIFTHPFMSVLKTTTAMEVTILYYTSLLWHPLPFNVTCDVYVLACCALNGLTARDVVTTQRMGIYN